MRLTIHIDDELFKTLSERSYVPVLRWRHFNTLCSTGEALANIKRRDLDKALPSVSPIPRRSPGDAEDTDCVLDSDDFAPDERKKYVDAARRLYARESAIEIDDNAEISATDEGGYVVAWVWIPNYEIEEKGDDK